MRSSIRLSAKHSQGGDLEFDSRNEGLIWTGFANQLEREAGEWVDAGEGTLTVTTQEMSFGKLLRKWRIPLAGIMNISSEGAILRLAVSGEKQPRFLELKPAELEVQLKSGDRSLSIDAELLVQRLANISDPNVRH